MGEVEHYPAGSLIVVATPIGNLGDLSPRAVKVLTDVDVITAEDTRHSGVLLARFGIDTPMLALHEHNEDAVVPGIVQRMSRGQRVAVISDAGTPLISDPGFVLTRAAREQGLGVFAVPGPCAAIAALSVAGLPSDRFVFEGFLPHRAAARCRRLEVLAREQRTLIIYESSHRIAQTARDMAGIFESDRQICVARELTKLHEQSVVLPARQLPDWLAGDANRRRGEFVLVVAGAPQSDAEAGFRVSLDALLRELLEHVSVSQAARIAARLTHSARNDAYAQALRIAGESKP